MTFRPCAILPSHNHVAVLGGIVARLREMGLAVIIVDDGSAEPAGSIIAGLHAPDHGVEVIRLRANRGKGVAVLTGFWHAAERGFSHAIQIDADGQHDTDQVPVFLAAAQAHPDALIAGRPIYDASVPLGRKLGRYMTHAWVWVETLSFRIQDSMCGFRIYPLAATIALIDREPIGTHMDFDTDILVRLFWRGTPVLQLPVRVTYPAGNTSNFQMLRDNIRITWMHVRLVIEMLFCLPSIWRNRPPVIADSMAAGPAPANTLIAGPESGPESGPDAASRHWPNVAEKGAAWGLKILAGLYALLGRRLCMIAMAPVVAYYYAIDAGGRRNSREFLARAYAKNGLPPPNHWTGLKHYMSFAGKILDGFIAWTHPERLAPITIKSNGTLDAYAASGSGVMLIVSHLGNAELSRAALSARFKRPVNVLLHTRHAAKYNALIKSVRPDAEANTIQVTEVGPDTAIALQERLERGEWLAIAGDRTPVTGQARMSRVPFLGQPAPFSHGPYILAALLQCPVYLMFCLGDASGHTVTFEPFAERIDLPRKDRETALTALAARYAQRLEHYSLLAPLQWYNFFDFWGTGEIAVAKRVVSAAAHPLAQP